MSFLTIPSQENLFTTVKCRTADGTADGADRLRSGDADEEDDDDEDDTDVRLIPRCSPVPRRRGSSIADETEEYMRIQRALSGGKRVSFKDTTGQDLVDVKEFRAFDSDEEDSAKWEEEEAKYRQSHGVPVFHVQKEFSVRSGGDLLQAVRNNKVEVENISAVEDEPLAVCGVIRVLNISFNKAVYIRCTMDSWISYYDHPADYVQGSHDGDTDQFCFKLCFASPYTTHGSRMEFVVRYETSEGDYWANNSNMNYVLTLLLSYEDKSSEKQMDLRDVRSILKPSKMHRTEINFESEDEPNKTEGEQEDSTRSGLVRPEAIRPAIFQPELDVELTEVHPSPTVPHDGTFVFVDGAESTHCETAQSLCPSSSLPHETCVAYVLQASTVLPLHESEQPNPSPLVPCSPASQESTYSPEWSQAKEEGAGPCVLVSLERPAPFVSAALGSEEHLPCSSCSSAQPQAQSQTSGGESGVFFKQQDSDCVDVPELDPGSGADPACGAAPDLVSDYDLPSDHDLLSDRPLAPSGEVLRSLRSSIISVSVLVSMVVVLQEPGALFVIGLFLILCLV